MALLFDTTLDIFVLLIGTLTLCFYFLKHQYSYWERKGFKTLPGYNYLSGHMKVVFVGRKAFVEGISRIYKESNERFSAIYLLLMPKLIIRDPELVRSVLIKDFSFFTDRDFPCNEKREPLSGHLFGLPGQRWRKLRAKLTPAFTSGKLKEMFPTLIDCGSTLQNYLEKLVDNNELLDVKEIAACHATNVIASVAFGIEVDTINDPNNPFRVCGRTITQPSFKSVVNKLSLVLLPKFANMLGLRFEDLSVERFIVSMVKQNLEYREKNNFERKDFFQLLIQLKNSGSVDDEMNITTKINESKKIMSLNEMAAQVYIFFSAGFETSSSTMCFCLYELAKNPDIQQRVHNEIDEVLAKHDGKLSYESISEMKFLETCIEETLRMYPILPFLTRLCVQNYRIPGTKNVIEKGVEVLIPVFALQRDEKYYDEPNRFNPDRFNDDCPAGRDQLNRPYLPFGDGPRNCIGLRLGKMQTKVGLFLMLQKFKYELEDGYENREMLFDPKVFLLTPNGQLNLKVLRR